MPAKSGRACMGTKWGETNILKKEKKAVETGFRTERARQLQMVL